MERNPAIFEGHAGVKPIGMEEDEARLKPTDGGYNDARDGM